MKGFSLPSPIGTPIKIGLPKNPIGAILGGGIGSGVAGVGGGLIGAQVGGNAGQNTPNNDNALYGLNNKDVQAGIKYGHEQAQGVKAEMDPTVQALKDRMNGTNPTADYMRQTANERKSEMASNAGLAGVKGGTLGRSLSGVDRQTTMDIGNQLYSQDTANIKNLYNAQANLANMQNSYEMGWAGIANNKPAQVQSPQNGFNNLFGLV